MIVSASYRTDIPAFYGKWFINRFRAGWAKVVNPHGGQIATIALRGGVDGFVFWTRNVAPFRDALSEVRDAGLPFVVQYTVTGYPRPLEASVVESARSVELIHQLAERHGRRSVVWRYDPVVITSRTPAAWHEDNFTRLCDRLAGAVDEVTVSFACIYRKTARNMAAAASAHRFSWSDPPAEIKRTLLSRLAGSAAERGMTLTICSQPDHGAAGTEPARCVDARRLEDVAATWGARRAIVAKAKGNRPGCLCCESRDIGAYDTCPHGCAYCYAVDSRTRAKLRFGQHDPAAEFLIPPTGAVPEGDAKLL